MDDKKKQTIETYRHSAVALGEKFDRLIARSEDIAEVFSMFDREEPQVLEIGCGSGRDAEEILRHTQNYLGIDVSEGLINLAREKNPDGRFEVADFFTYAFPEHLDIIFAFASLIHAPKPVLREILTKASSALVSGGLFRLSMKYADSYREVAKEDAYGTRTYYHYSEQDIHSLCEGYHILKNNRNTYRGQDWLEILLRNI